jgi:hypothetical protein
MPATPAETFHKAHTRTPADAASGQPRQRRQFPGHRSITSTAVYTALAPNRFKDFWRD